MKKREAAERLERTSYLTALFTAVRFLTVVPINWRNDQDGAHFKKAIVFFPVVGLLIGCGGVVLVLTGRTIFPGSVLSFFLILYLSGISGFLHMDGVSDSGDGLLSYRSRERSLEIMKDSRVGAMGVIVVVLLLLGKYSSLVAIPVEHLVKAAIILPIGGRLAILFTMTFFPYGRREGGLGGLFYSTQSRAGVLGGTLLLLIIVLYTNGFLTALFILGVVVCTAFMFGLFCTSRLGGVTGDTLGATCEITELVVALALCALYYPGIAG